MLSVEPGEPYRILDAGDGERLEALGRLRIVRPAPTATQTKKDPKAWLGVDVRFDSDKRVWQPAIELENDLILSAGGITFAAHLAPTGQIGVFAEHAFVWNLLRALPAPQHILHLFAHTGLGSIAAAHAGHRVCHVDAARSPVERARRNAALNTVPNQIRWIVDDAMKFVRREVRRGRSYDGFVIDPPSFGRGSGAGTWQWKRDIQPLMESVKALSDSRPEFVILTGHSTGLARSDLEGLMRESFHLHDDREVQSIRLFVRAESGAEIPAGFAGIYMSGGLAEHWSPIINRWDGRIDRE